MSKSIKVNFAYNLINTFSSILFPLIAFPYAARIMEADGIGRINFLSSIISYVTLFTSLGIPLYAIRVISKARDDLYKRNHAAKEILSLHLILVAVGYIIVLLIAIFVPKIHEDVALFLLLSLCIFFSAIGCEWFYQGTEDFKYITIRALIIRTVSLVFLFLLVKSKSDIYWYAGYSVVGSVGNNLFNFHRLYDKLKTTSIPTRDLHPTRHLLPALHVFALNLIISIYLNLNLVMLGFMHSSESVGLFTGATRMTNIALGFVTALGTVMLPRLSNLLATGKMEEFRTLSQKAFSFIFAVSFPLSVGVACCADFLITLLCGDTYYGAIVTLQIISPIIFMIALSGVMGIQILYPQGKENLVIWSTVGGAFFNFVLNCLLIPLYSYTGAAVSTFIAELVVLTIQIIWGRKYIPFPIFEKKYLNYLLASLLMSVVVLLLVLSITNIWIVLSAAVIVGCIIYAGTLWIMKDSLLQEALNYVCKLLKR